MACLACLVIGSLRLGEASQTMRSRTACAKCTQLPYPDVGRTICLCLNNMKDSPCHSHHDLPRLNTAKLAMEGGLSQNGWCASVTTSEDSSMMNDTVEHIPRATHACQHATRCPRSTFRSDKRRPACDLLEPLCIYKDRVPFACLEARPL